jgi:phosphoribosylformimino-5-aminoimidazole carboxamide ribotide isomerase
MRLIPVMDLLDGQAVHAIKGDRARYKPVKSVLCNTSDPMTLARAFRDQLGLNRIYIADLNAIQDSGRTNHRDLITALACREKLDVILDAGTSDAEEARAWLELGVRKVVIGSETLHTADALRDIPVKIEQNQRIFSLDLHAGKILSRYPALAVMSPMGALQHLQSFGWREIILLDLKRVGSGVGVDYALMAEARVRYPGLRLLAGGGIRSPGELMELESLGAAGVLVATALHHGTITAQHISALEPSK